MHLSSNTLYLICVLGIGQWLTYQNDFNNNTNSNNTSYNAYGDFSNGNNDVYSDTFRTLLSESTTSKCTQVRTLFALPSIEMDGLSGGGFIHSILTRRLGLIVGCCLGIIVFIVLISVLGWLKLKKQRIERAKRQQPITQEYMTYRSYSISNEESIVTKDTAVMQSNSITNNLVGISDLPHSNLPISNNMPHAMINNCPHHISHSHAHPPPTYIASSIMGANPS